MPKKKYKRVKSNSSRFDHVECINMCYFYFYYSLLMKQHVFYLSSCGDKEKCHQEVSFPGKVLCLNSPHQQSEYLAKQMIISTFVILRKRKLGYNIDINLKS